MRLNKVDYSWIKSHKVRHLLTIQRRRIQYLESEVERLGGHLYLSDHFPDIKALAEEKAEEVEAERAVNE